VSRATLCHAGLTDRRGLRRSAVPVLEKCAPFVAAAVFLVTVLGARSRREHRRRCRFRPCTQLFPLSPPFSFLFPAPSHSRRTRRLIALPEGASFATGPWRMENMAAGRCRVYTLPGEWRTIRSVLFSRSLIRSPLPFGSLVLMRV